MIAFCSKPIDGVNPLNGWQTNILECFLIYFLLFLCLFIIWFIAFLIINKLREVKNGDKPRD